MTSRIFKTRFFDRQMQKIGLSDELLLNAVYEKNQRDNINEKELRFLKDFAADLLTFADARLSNALESKDLWEISNEQK